MTEFRNSATPVVPMTSIWSSNGDANVLVVGTTIYNLDRVQWVEMAPNRNGCDVRLAFGGADQARITCPSRQHAANLMVHVLQALTGRTPELIRKDLLPYWEGSDV